MPVGTMELPQWSPVGQRNEKLRAFAMLQKEKKLGPMRAVVQQQVVTQQVPLGRGKRRRARRATRATAAGDELLPGLGEGDIGWDGSIG